MKNGKTVVAIALALGLATTSLAVYAHEEEGVTSEPQVHHKTQGRHAHRGVKKGVKSESAGEKAGTSVEGTTAQHHHGYGHGVPAGGHGVPEGGHGVPEGGHGVPEGGHGGMEEGSH
jgi:hypothetical protein